MLGDDAVVVDPGRLRAGVEAEAAGGAGQSREKIIMGKEMVPALKSKVQLALFSRVKVMVFPELVSLKA